MADGSSQDPVATAEVEENWSWQFKLLDATVHGDCGI